MFSTQSSSSSACLHIHIIVLSVNRIMLADALITKQMHMYLNEILSTEHYIATLVSTALIEVLQHEASIQGQCWAQMLLEQIIFNF